MAETNDAAPPEAPKPSPLPNRPVSGEEISTAVKYILDMDDSNDAWFRLMIFDSCDEDRAKLWFQLHSSIEFDIGELCIKVAQIAIYARRGQEAPLTDFFKEKDGGLNLARSVIAYCDQLKELNSAADQLPEIVLGPAVTTKEGPEE